MTAPESLQKLLPLLFMMIGPIKLIPAFAMLACELDAPLRRRLALRSSLFAMLAASLAMLTGYQILSGWGATPASLSKDELVTKSFQAKDIPAFTDENFISNTNNYLSSLEFNIKSMDHPTMGKVSFSQTSDQQIQSLPQNEDYFPDEYSRYVLDCNQAPSAYQEITELLPRAFTLVRDQIGWNKRHGIAASKPIKFIKENQSTNVAGKNLLLYQLLKSLNIDAKPVLISTIEHGWVFPSIATLQDFNYLIVQVKLPGKTIFLDASQPDNLYGCLRRECLNGPGLLLDENHGQWIDILPSSASGTKQKKFKLNLYPESEHFTGTYRMNFSGHQAQDFC